MELPAQRKFDDYEYTTVDGFAQKYGFSRDQAIGRIKWFFCATEREALWESEKIFIQRSEGRMRIFTPDDIVAYEAIVAAEKPKPKRKSTMDEGHKAAKALFAEAYRAVVKSGEKPTEVNVLKRLKEMSTGDDELFVFPSKKRFEYAGTEIDYSTYKHWLTALNK